MPVCDQDVDRAGRSHGRLKPCFDRRFVHVIDGHPDVSAGFLSAQRQGGGLRFGFRQRLIVRVEGRSHVFFDANNLTAQEEISGGLSAFF